MIDLRIGPDSDLVITGQDLALVSGPEATAQHARMRLQTWLAETPYDRNAGVPWRQVLLQRGTPDGVIDATLRGVLLATPGVTRVDSLDLDYDRTTGTMSGTITIAVQDATQSVILPLEVTP